MQDKGYPYPLYSLDLLRDATEPPEDDFHAIPTAGGRLVVRRRLIEQGRHTSTQACVRATRAALAHHPYAQEAFGRNGLDDPWTEHMRHWIAQAQDLEARWHLKSGHALIERLPRQDLPEQAQHIWTRLRLASELAGLGGAVVRGRLPRGRLAIQEVLRAALEVLGDPDIARRLAPCGIGPDDRLALQALIDGLAAAGTQDRLLQRQQRQVQGALVVVRGALLGDVAHFCRLARLLFPPESRRELRLQRLLG